MNNTSIETAQNVTIEYKLAGIDERIFAFFLDGLIVGSFYIVIILIGQTIYSSAYGAIPFISIILSFYHLLMEYFAGGQSLGKKIMKIKVVRKDGKEVNIGNYFLRWIFRWVDISFTLGSVATLTILFGNKGQRLGDILANTLVVSTKPSANIMDTFFIDLGDGYEVKYPEIGMLTDEDIVTVKKVIAFVQKQQTERSAKIALETKMALEKKMGIESDLKTRDFFECILKDYTAYHSASTPKI